MPNRIDYKNVDIKSKNGNMRDKSTFACEDKG